MSVPEPLFRADHGIMHAHLQRLFGAVPNAYPGGLLEIRCIDPRRERPAVAALFECTQAGFVEAAAYAAEHNAARFNIYVGANPRKSGTARHAAASDTDVEIAFVQFVDLDKGPDCRERLEAGRIGPCFVVPTGSVPFPRLHAYWELDLPTRNLPAWTTTQEALAAHFGGDTVVKNPSRIMRLAGTVAIPDTGKAQRGYKIERSTLEILSETDEGVPAEALLSVYGGAQPAQQPEDAQQAEPPPVGTSGLSTSGTLLARMLSGDHWHDNMVRLAAHWVGRGWSTVEILTAAPGITLPGYTVDQTRRELLKAVDGARRKWDRPDVEQLIETASASAPDTFALLDAEGTYNMTPPDWLVDGLIAERSFAPIYGPSGSLKSFIALDLALRISLGMPWRDKRVKQAGVLYVAAEGAGGIGKRVEAWMQHNGVTQAPNLIRFLPQAVNLMDENETGRLIRTALHLAEQEGVKVEVVVLDTLARCMVGVDENSAQEIGRAIDAGALVQRSIGCALVPIHHSGKNAEMGMRGSSALLGASDTVLRVTRGEEDQRNRVTIEVEKQKDGEDGERFMFETQVVPLAPKHGLEARSSLVLLPTDKPPPKRTMDPDLRDNLHRQIALALGEAGSMSINALALALGLPSGRKRQEMAESLPFYPDYATIALNGGLAVRLFKARTGTAPTAPIKVVRAEPPK